MTDFKSPARATIAEVAKRAGVSIATVSRVINHTAQVSHDVSDRVQAAIAELNYKPHTAAKSLASRRTNTIGLLLPTISGEFFMPMLRGVESAIKHAGYDLLISTKGGHRQEGQPSPLGIHNTDGLLVFTDGLSDSELAQLYQAGYPMVLLYRSPPLELPIPSVNIENKSGARQLVDHFIEVHHCHRIAFLAGSAGTEDLYWREMGYRESLAEHGIPFDPTLVSLDGFTEGEASLRVRQWLNRGIAFDAVFAGDDDMAVGTLTALREHGKRVPEDVAVGGFDDLPLARHLAPPLTTIRAQPEKAGYEAASQLVRLIRNEPADLHTLLPTELVIRQSCGCP